MRTWLKELRVSKKKTQKEIAFLAHISPQYYNYIENGERGDKLPVPTARKIADALEFNWQLFYDRDGFTNTDDQNSQFLVGSSESHTR